MARRIFDFDPPSRFVAGTVGEPGARTFFLQARDGRRIVSISLEKVQVAALAERLGRLLFELDRRGIAELGDAAGGAAGPAAATPATARASTAKAATAKPVADVAPLDEPLHEAFRAGTLTLGWDGESGKILIEAREIQEDDEDEPSEEAETISDDDPDGPDVFRVRIALETARAFVERATRVIQAGRPPCPLCGNPLDPQGHICPRRNGQYVH